jgi:lysophospholipase L1-like esterase
VLNTGVSGNRVIDLESRWQTDVIDLEPHWLSIMIGINDVWRHFDSPLLEPQVDIDTYRSTLRRLVDRTMPLLDGLVLLSPYYLEPNRNDPMRAMMDSFGAVVREVASESGACFGDTQAAFDRFLESNPTQMLCGDRVHPNLKGHSIIASCFLDTIGFTWNSNR